MPTTTPETKYETTILVRVAVATDGTVRVFTGPSANELMTVEGSLREALDAIRSEFDFQLDLAREEAEENVEVKA